MTALVHTTRPRSSGTIPSSTTIIGRRHICRVSHKNTTLIQGFALKFNSVYWSSTACTFNFGYWQYGELSKSSYGDSEGTKWWSRRCSNKKIKSKPRVKKRRARRSRFAGRSSTELHGKKLHGKIRRKKKTTWRGEEGRLLGRTQIKRRSNERVIHAQHRHVPRLASTRCTVAVRNIRVVQENYHKRVVVDLLKEVEETRIDHRTAEPEHHAPQIRAPRRVATHREHTIASLPTETRRPSVSRI